jgi:metal-sulfur cluster biosynthetic enzyme
MREMERELVDTVEIKGDTVRVRYNLTVPFCPKPFALHIGQEIR